MPALVNALKRVDFPTLGKPTMPHLRLISLSVVNECHWINLTERRGTLRTERRCDLAAPHGLFFLFIPGVQLHHCRLAIALCYQRPNFQAALDSLLYQDQLFFARRL